MSRGRTRTLEVPACLPASLPHPGLLGLARPARGSLGAGRGETESSRRAGSGQGLARSSGALVSDRTPLRCPHPAPAHAPCPVPPWEPGRGPRTTWATADSPHSASGRAAGPGSGRTLTQKRKGCGAGPCEVGAGTGNRPRPALGWPRRAGGVSFPAGRTGRGAGERGAGCGPARGTCGRRPRPRSCPSSFCLGRQPPWDPSAFGADVIFSLFLGRLFFHKRSEGAGEEGLVAAVCPPSLLRSHSPPQGRSAGSQRSGQQTGHSQPAESWEPWDTPGPVPLGHKAMEST